MKRMRSILNKVLIALCVIILLTWGMRRSLAVGVFLHAQDSLYLAYLGMVGNQTVLATMAASRASESTYLRLDVRDRSMMEPLLSREGSVSCLGFTLVRQTRGKWMIAVPDWFLVLLLGLAPAIGFHRARQRARRLRNGFCPHCGYDLRATPDRCPECGTAVSVDLTRNAVT